MGGGRKWAPRTRGHWRNDDSQLATLKATRANDKTTL